MKLVVRTPHDVPVEYTPASALAELDRQHAELRRMMMHCEELADAVDADAIGPMQLVREIAKLRVAFVEHNAFEEQILRPILLRGDASAGVRIDRLVAQHVDEHRALHHRLGGNELTADLRATIADLAAHLEAEERYLVARMPAR